MHFKKGYHNLKRAGFSKGVFMHIKKDADAFCCNIK